MAGNAIASHLKFMRNGRRCPGQLRSAQTGRCDAAPVDVDEQFFAGHLDMTLPAGLVFRMGCDRRMFFELLRPATPGVAGQALDPG